MAHRLRVSPLPRILLFLILALPLTRAAPAHAQDGPTQWQPLGGPGGRVTQLAAGPDAKDLYAVSVVSVNRQPDQTQSRDGGTPARADALYVSHDRGVSWQPATNDLPPGEITALYVDRAGQVWTGIRGREDVPGRASRLLRSQDRGATWREISLPRPDGVIRTITENAGRDLLVAVVDAAGAEQGEVYRSADGGASWTGQPVSADGAGPNARLARLIAHPTQAGVLFVLTTNGDLLRSTDGGSTWTAVSEVPASAAGSAQLAFLPGRPDTALLVQSQNAAIRVRRSTDAGATWSDVAASGLEGGAAELRSMLALSPDVLLLNTETGTYRSADGGRRWQPLEGSLNSGSVRGFAALASDGRSVLAATDNGLFGSSDGGAIWRAYGVGLPVNSAVGALLTHKDRPATIVASLVAAGDADPPELLVTRDAGRSWLPADGGRVWSDATAWAIDPNNADNLYVAGDNYVAASKDGGLSWKVHSASDFKRTAIAVAPSDSKRVYVDGAPRLVSEDGGETWRELPIHSLGGGVEMARGVAVDPANADHVWFGLQDGVRESKDGGLTMQRSGTSAFTADWLAAPVKDGQGGELQLFGGVQDGGLMRWNPTMRDWEAAQTGLPPASTILAFAADPRTPGLLWAARDGGGVYRSTDGGDTWTNVGAGLGENLGLALAIDYQTPGSVLLGTATAGAWVLGSNGPSPMATSTPAGSPTSAPVTRSGKAGVDARIEVLWPHDFAPIDQAEQANIGIRLFAPGSLQTPACGWQPKVQLWQAIDNEPAELVELAEQRSVDGQAFPYWEANDIDVSAARDGSRKIYFLTAVDGVATATSVWAHAADARTYFPEQQVPSGIATGPVDAVDARIQIVWPHDASGAEAGVENATLANVAVTLFKHGTRLSVPADWSGPVTLYGAWDSEVARPLGTQPAVGTRQAGVINYPVWEFNDVPVDRARDPSSRLYLWAVAENVKSYPTIWAHGADARTYFPAKDEPIQGCLP